MSTLNLELYIPEALGRAVTSSLSLDPSFCLWCFLGVLWQDLNSGITLKEPVLNCRLQRYTNVPAHTVCQQPTLFFSYCLLSWEPKVPWLGDLTFGGPWAWVVDCRGLLCLHHCLAHSGRFTYLLQESTSGGTDQYADAPFVGDINLVFDSVLWKWELLQLISIAWMKRPALWGLQTLILTSTKLRHML